MPLSDVDLMTVLDSLESRAVLPDSCDAGSFADEGLIEAVDGGWALTVKGRLTLANLRTMHRQQIKEY